jgi:hypothetical protein
MTAVAEEKSNFSESPPPSSAQKSSSFGGLGDSESEKSESSESISGTSVS